ncbi:MAG: DUF3604 domain-containing protein [Promethearchaeota archaeon]
MDFKNNNLGKNDSENFNNEIRGNNKGDITNSELSSEDRWFSVLKIHLLKAIRIIVYLSSIYTTMLFWFSFLGIIIGFLFYFLSKDKKWKLHGIVLAYAAGLETFMAESSEEGLMKGIGIAFGLIIIIPYVLINLFLYLFHKIYNYLRKSNRKDHTLRKKGKEDANEHIKSSFSRYFSSINPSLKAKLVLISRIIVIILPIIFWSSVSINLEVLFNNNPQLIWIHAPSTVAPSEQFEITVESWDKFERLSAVYKGTVNFSLVTYNLTSLELIPSNSVSAELPPAYTFTGQNIGSAWAYTINDGKDNGLHRFKMKIDTEGLHYLKVYDSITKNYYWSNPILVANYLNNQNIRLYWGDLHTHSMLSDGSGSAEHSFYYARYVAKLDFYALSDHGEHLNTFGLNEYWFKLAENAANEAYESNKFVTFQAVEWTSPLLNYKYSFGHYVIVLTGNELPHIASNKIQTPNELWEFLDQYTAQKGVKAIAIPHHTVRATFIQDWMYANPTYVRTAEAFSVHGESLFDPYSEYAYVGSVDVPRHRILGSSIMDALTMGHTFVLCADTDEHDGHPGHSLSHTQTYIGHQPPFSIWHPRNAHPYPGGLTAVWAENLTREGIMDAYYNQHLYGSTDFSRPIINFTINGYGVGQAPFINVSTPISIRNISIFIAQDGSPAPSYYKEARVFPNWCPDWNAKVEIFKNGILWKSIDINKPVSNIKVNDTESITGASYSNKCVKIKDKWFINPQSDYPMTEFEKNNLNTNSTDFYVVRIVGNNGRYAYIGPIWVRSAL